MIRLRRRDRLTGPPNEIVTFLLGAAVITGGSVLLTGTAPSSIEQTLPPWLRYGWALCLLVGGALSIAGAYWLGDPYMGATLCLAGLLPTGFACLAYGTALLTTFGHAISGAAADPNIGFGLACLAWSIRIGYLLLQVHRLAIAKRAETAAKELT